MRSSPVRLFDDAPDEPERDAAVPMRRPKEGQSLERYLEAVLNDAHRVWRAWWEIHGQGHLHRVGESGDSVKMPGGAGEV